MIPSFLMDSENWTGTYYELSMEFFPKGDDATILNALKAISRLPWFRGTWNRENYEQTEIDTFDNHYVGTLTIGEEKVVGCAVIVIREDDLNGSDWVDLCIPCSMLERVFPVYYPLTLTKDPWIQEVDDLFLQIAKHIYDDAPFQLGIIGEEVSGYTYHHHFSSIHVNHGVYVLPKSLAEKASEFCIPLQLSLDLSYLPMID